MKIVNSVFSILFFLFLCAEFSPALAQGSSTSHPAIGWQDANHDGINDRFADANGDGINDRTGKPYPHQFPFVDANKDGINDIYKDADGDGVNDYGFQGPKKDWFLDADGDGKNDVTGRALGLKDFRHQQLGYWDELHQRRRLPFLDENGDGIDDRMESGKMRHPKEGMRHQQKRRLDRFIDEDGDGIADHRMGRLRLHPRKGRMGRGPGHGPGHP